MSRPPREVKDSLLGTHRLVRRPGRAGRPGRGAHPLDAVTRALEGGHLDLDEQLGPGQAGHATAERRRVAAGEPRRPLAVRPVHVRAGDGERAAADDVVESGTGLSQGPPDGPVGDIRLARPVARGFDLARRIHRRAPADVDPVANRHRPGVPAGPLPLALGVDVAPDTGRADDGLGLDLDEHLGKHQAGDAQQGRRGPDVAERLQPGPRVLGRLRQIGHEGLRCIRDRRACRPPRPGPRGWSPWWRGSAGTCRPARRPHPGIEGRGARDEHAVAHPHRAGVRVLGLDGPAGGDPPRRLPGAVHRVELDLDELLRPGQTTHLDQGGDRPRVPEVLRVGPGRRSASAMSVT